MSASPHAPHIQGIGGIFVFAADPNALATWYRDIFGVPTQADGKTHFAEFPSADLHPGDRISTLTFAIMPSTGPRSDDKTAQINWRVTDLEVAIAVLECHGVEVTRKGEMDDYGRFAQAPLNDGPPPNARSRGAYQHRQITHRQ